MKFTKNNYFSRIVAYYVISIYQSNRYPFLCVLWLAPITCDTQDYDVILRRKLKWQEVHVLKLEKKFTLYCFFENKVRFLSHYFVKY